MADLIADYVPSSGVPSSGGPSPMSFLNKLPTKRIDAVITAAAVSGIPEQGEQTGGYNPTYAHLSHLPLFPLYSDAQQDALATAHARKERKVKQMDATDPDKLLSGSQKATLSVVGHLSGAGSIVSMKRWERRLVGANVVTSNMLMQQSKLIVFTRWTVPTVHGIPWFVDVLEHRNFDPGSKLGGNVVMLKAGLAPAPSGTKKESKVTFKLLNTDAKGIKSQKMWRKLWNFEPCEAITFASDDGREFPMEIVARIQRACSAVEANEMRKRFEKEWGVPVLVSQ